MTTTTGSNAGALRPRRAILTWLGTLSSRHARSNSDDRLVDTAWAYMTLKRASRRAMDVDAAAQAEEAFEVLASVIESRGRRDPYAVSRLRKSGFGLGETVAASAS